MDVLSRRMFATDFFVGGSQLYPAVGTKRLGGTCSGHLEMDVFPLPFPDLDIITHSLLPPAQQSPIWTIGLVRRIR